MGASSSSLTCPQADGTIYTSSSQNFRVNCFNDSIYGDINYEAPVVVTSLESCIERCVSVRGCIDVSYIPTKSECWLKSSVNSGTHNGLVWGAELITTSTTTSSPTTTPTQAPLSCGSTPGAVSNPTFAQGLTPWISAGPDSSYSYVVTNAPAGTPLGSSFYLFNSSSTHRNTITQRVCGLSSGLTYNAIVRYTFAQVADNNTSANQDMFYPQYDLQILVNGTNAQSLKMTPSQSNANEFYSESVLIKSTGGTQMDLGVSWGTADGAAAKGENNVWAVMEVGNIQLQRAG
jgi:hypothetical protein